MSEFSAAEQQVLITLWECHQRGETPDRAALEQHGQTYFLRSKVAWDGAVEDLAGRGAVTISNAAIQLSEPGAITAQALHAAHPSIYYFYVDFYAVAPRSAASAEFCTRVYGQDLCQHGYADMTQLDRLIEVAQIGPASRVLDLGCGTGQIAEYISDVTGAVVHGIDYIPAAIDLAQARTRAKRDRLSFSVADINHLDIPPRSIDTLVAIDTLYFSDLTTVLGTLRELLVPGGQMVIYYITLLFDEHADRSTVQPDRTALAQALTHHGLPYHTWDFTQTEYARAQNAQRVLEELKPAFGAEGNAFLYTNRKMETDGNIHFIDGGRASRYLYHVVLPDQV